MKHSWKITLILLAMFLITQLLGILVVALYAPQVHQTTNEEGEVVNETVYNLPYGVNPPADVEQKSTTSLIISFIIAFAIAIAAMFLLMKYSAEMLIRIWFFIVVTLAIGITVNSFILKIPYSSLIALVVAFPLAFYKIFKKQIIIHNITELIIYPGIAAIFVSVINAWTNYPITAAIILFIIISAYDIYAVWHAGLMQKMANYQIKNLKLFTGFFVPYLGKKERELVARASKSKKMKKKKVKVNVAILGGGDVVFPIILAGVSFYSLGLISALLVSLGSTLALLYLFYTSEKGKFYPAMPFITVGAFLGLLIGYLL